MNVNAFLCRFKIENVLLPVQKPTTEQWGKTFNELKEDMFRELGGDVPALVIDTSQKFDASKFTDRNFSIKSLRKYRFARFIKTLQFKEYGEKTLDFKGVYYDKLNLVSDVEGPYSTSELKSASSFSAVTSSTTLGCLDVHISSCTGTDMEAALVEDPSPADYVSPSHYNEMLWPEIDFIVTGTDNHPNKLHIVFGYGLLSGSVMVYL
ncbi:unnamed protein product [Allacma fusca]|uniref:Uncharacterized protein n=1 Tax=Allacma fusca TaxID=39272 RepID=A0A8J2K7U5_9HEXA|nr:unnamed protein product [Allacma fusca]